MYVLKTAVRKTEVLRREDLIDGQPYIVFPMVMMVEGVHHGSHGASFYSAEQLSKDAEAWNMKPIVVRHPEDSGVPVSACSKEIIEKQGVGVILNTIFEDGKLKSEAWINRQKAEKIYPGLIAMLSMGSIMELSIGHFAEDVLEEGVWNNETYDRKITVIKPDHVALLPTEKGACSVADGAGIPRLNKDHQLTLDIRSNKNKVSFEEIRELLYRNLEKVNNKIPYIEAVYDDFFVYTEFNIDTSEETLFKRSYSLKENSMDIGAPERVRRSISYITANKETKSMDELLNLLKEKGLSPEGLEVLKSLSEKDSKTFNDLVTNLKTELEAKVTPSKPQEDEPGLTVNEFLEKVPDRFREVLEDGVRLFEKRKSELVSGIVANKKNVFSKEELSEMNVNALEKLHALAKGSDYSVGGGAVPVPEPVSIQPLEEVEFFKGDK